MITTRQINVDLTKGKLKLRHVSTKDIDAGVRVEPPKEPIKPRSVSTTTLPDVADMAEKKRRDDIMAERKVEEKAKPVIKVDEEDLLMTAKFVPSEKIADIVRDSTRKVARLDDEGLKKLAMKKRMAKVRAAKAKKK